MDVNSAWTGDVGWGLFPDAASGGRTLWQPCSGLAQEAGTCMSAQAPIEDTRPAPRPGGLRMRRPLLTVPLAVLALLCVAAPAQALPRRPLRPILATLCARPVAVALAHAVVTRSGKRSCGPVGLERSVGVRRVTKRVAYASGDAEGEAIVSPNCPDAP